MANVSQAQQGISTAVPTQACSGPRAKLVGLSGPATSLAGWNYNNGQLTVPSNATPGDYQVIIGDPSVLPIITCSIPVTVVPPLSNAPAPGPTNPGCGN